MTTIKRVNYDAMTVQDLGFQTISEAARVAGIARQNLWKMLNGREEPSVRLCFRFSKAWGVDITTVLALFYPKEIEI